MPENYFAIMRDMFDNAWILSLFLTTRHFSAKPLSGRTSKGIGPMAGYPSGFTLWDQGGRSRKTNPA